ncbi:MAG: AMP-binding protein [Candidatus Obscuribacterales bacterium]|nr:AMP-binding protein [Candidatus Obscuribacterales bacterium]
MILIHKFWSQVRENPKANFLIQRRFTSSSSALSYLSREEAAWRVSAFVSFLKKAGVQRGERVCILSWNSPEWIYADLAIQSIGAITVPIYPKSSADQVTQIATHSKARLVFAGDEEQASKVHGLDAVILSSFSSSPLEFKLESDAAREYQYFLAEAESAVFNQIDENDVSTLMYTSGSSGVPKGVEQKHKAISVNIQAMLALGLNMDPEKDIYLDYLPMAHIFEPNSGIGLSIWSGVPIAISPVDKVAEGLKLFKPSVLLGVPAVWEKFKAGIFEPKEGLAKTLHRLGLWKKLLNYALCSPRRSLRGRLLDKLLLDKIRAKLGGRLRLLVSGGAAINADTLKFFNNLGLEMIEGYGLTETTGACCTNRPATAPGSGPKNVVGSVGFALDGYEIKIVPLEGEEHGLGEIYVRGDGVFSRYWDAPEQTAEAFDGPWFKTNDLGRIDENGFVFLAGRKDGMYKTLQGKFVSRDKVEGALKHSSLIQYSVPVAHGRKYTTALIFLNIERAAEICGRRAPAQGDPAAYYAEQPEVKAAVDAAVAEANKELEHWEAVQKVWIVPLAPSTENGIITETMKIRSKVLIKRFAAEIDALYASGSAKAS